MTARPLGRSSYGRRVSAGFRVPAGACSTLPAWWGRDTWVNVDVWCTVAASRELCREEHVDPDTVVRVARAMAGYADRRTGRDCRPTNERLACDLQMSVRQAQRARRVLIRLKLVAELVRGRSIMTRAERLAAWRRGSAHRQLASEFALLSLRRRPQGRRPPVERVIPPGHPEGVSPGNLDQGFFTAKTRWRSAASRRTHSRRPPPAPTLAQTRTQRLAAGLRTRLGWLAGVSPRRLTSLHRFAQHGWTEADVVRALDGVLRSRGWTVPDELREPAAYLAMLLRCIDPADLAIDQQRAAEQPARDQWVRLTTLTGTPCRHGQPAGDLPHPIDGYLSCPWCRHETEAPKSTHSAERDLALVGAYDAAVDGGQVAEPVGDVQHPRCVERDRRELAVGRVVDAHFDGAIDDAQPQHERSAARVADRDLDDAHGRLSS